MTTVAAGASLRPDRVTEHGAAPSLKIVLGEVAATKSANIAFIKNTAQEMKLIS